MVWLGYYIAHYQAVNVDKYLFASLETTFTTAVSVEGGECNSDQDSPESPMTKATILVMTMNILVRR